MDVLRIHESLDAREMTNQLSRREASGPGLPFEIFLAYGIDDATRSLVNAIQVFDERRDSGDFHDRRSKG
jgi:hypothetical protein